MNVLQNAINLIRDGFCFMNDNITQTSAQEFTEELPWLVFKLHNLAYTVNSRIVNGILQYPDTITPVASAPEIFRGLMNSRGGIIPLLDLRALFSLKSTQEDYNEFMALVNDMKSETDTFYFSVSSSIASGEIADFAQETPSTSKWKFQALRHQTKDSTSYKELPFSLVELIDEFVNYSNGVFSLIKNRKQSDEDIRKSPEFSNLKRIKDEIHKVLTDSIEAYQEKYKEMIVTVSNGDSVLGLIVDEVVAVEFLDILSDEEHFPKFQKSRFFCGVARSSRVQGEILILNEEMVLQMSREFESAEY
jgi:chemotaxis signal transduction protein